MSTWPNFATVTKKLCIFAVFNIILINLILLFLFKTKINYITPSYILSFLQFNSDSDSWWPMQVAFNYLQSKSPKLLYDAVFLEQNIKFQYPVTSLLIFPFSKLLVPDAKLETFFNIISSLALIITAIFVIKIFMTSLQSSLEKTGGDISAYFSKSELIVIYVVLFCLTFSFYPIIKAYKIGQIQVWINCLFTLIIWCWIKDKKKIAGILAGLMCLIKPQYGIILVWGFFRKQWSFITTFLSVFGLGLLISITLFGFLNHINYLSALSFISRHGESYYPNQSVNGLLNRLLSNGNNLRFFADSFPPFNRLVYFGTLISSLFFLSLAFFSVPRAARGSTIDLAIIGITSTMASPIAWEHHYGITLSIYAFLFPPLLLDKNPFNKPLLYLTASYILASNYLQFINILTYNKKYNFLQSYLFFAGLMLLGYCYYLSRKKPEVRELNSSG